MSKDERREFMAVFPDIVRDLTETHRQTEIPDVTKWYSKVSGCLLFIQISSLWLLTVSRGDNNKTIQEYGGWKIL